MLEYWARSVMFGRTGCAISHPQHSTIPSLHIHSATERYMITTCYRRYNTLRVFLFVLLCIDFFLSSQALSQDKGNPLSTPVSKKLTLVEATMCEGIKDYIPQNQAIVFSMTIGKVSCFTSFDPVPEKTFIYHKWFHRDKPSIKIKLSLQPPCWSTFSSIQLREADKGPWRVEVIDREGNILDIIRFSITD